MQGSGAISQVVQPHCCWCATCGDPHGHLLCRHHADPMLHGSLCPEWMMAPELTVSFLDADSKTFRTKFCCAMIGDGKQKQKTTTTINQETGQFNSPNLQGYNPEHSERQR